VKTTDERPHLRRGLPERGVSPIGWLRTELAIGNQVHTPLHCSQKRQTHPASPFQAPTGLRSPALEPGPDPFPSGHILLGRRINRSVPRRPAVPKRQPRAAEVSPGGVDASFPAVPAPKSDTPSTRRVPALTITSLQGGSGPARSGSLRTGPSRAFAESKADLPSQPPLALGHPTAPQQQSPGRHPWQACTLSVLTLHVVGKAHFYQHVDSNVPGG
jgi:hypothetical protein